MNSIIVNSTLKVLLIIPSALVLVRISDVLRKSFPRVFPLVANTASEAYEYLADNKFDIVIMDVTLPDENGITFLRNLSNQYPFSFIIIFTSSHEPQLKTAFLKNGANMFLTKPGDLSKIVTIVRKFKKTKGI